MDHLVLSPRGACRRGCLPLQTAQDCESVEDRSPSSSSASKMWLYLAGLEELREAGLTAKQIRATMDRLQELDERGEYVVYWSDLRLSDAIVTKLKKKLRIR